MKNKPYYFIVPITFSESDGVPYFSIRRISDDENDKSFEWYDNFDIARQQDVCKKCSKKITDKFCEELYKLEEKYNDLKFLKEITNDH